MLVSACLCLPLPDLESAQERLTDRGSWTAIEADCVVELQALPHNFVCFYYCTYSIRVHSTLRSTEYAVDATYNLRDKLSTVQATRKCFRTHNALPRWVCTTFSC